MKLIEEIIDLLSSNEPSLTTALMKTKVLLHRLGEKDLLEWVDGELKGYPNVDNLPDYRILRVTVRGNVSNMAYRYTGQILPTMHLEKKIKNRLETTYLTNSIAVRLCFLNRVSEQNSHHCSNIKLYSGFQAYLA